MRPPFGRLVDAALAARREERAAGGDVDHVRVGRVRDDAPGRAAVVEAALLPGLPAVAGAVDAGAAEGDAAAARVQLARAGPDRAVGALGDGAHRLRGVVRPRLLERAAGVGRLPDAAGRRRDVDGVLLRAVDDEVDEPAADVRRPLERPARTALGGRGRGAERACLADGAREGLTARQLAPRRALEEEVVVRLGRAEALLLFLFALSLALRRREDRGLARLVAARDGEHAEHPRVHEHHGQQQQPHLLHGVRLPRSACSDQGS